MIIDAKIVFILLIVLASTAFISLFLSKTLFKLMFFLSVISDTALLFILTIGRFTMEPDLSLSKSTYEEYAIVIVLLKFILMSIYSLYINRHTSNSNSVEKDYRPKNYD